MRGPRGSITCVFGFQGLCKAWTCFFFVLGFDRNSRFLEVGLSKTLGLV